jgi:hypothetical protein
MTDALTSLDMSTGLRKVAERAKREPAARFNSLAHLIDEDLLARAYRRLRRHAAVGVDDISKEQYGQDLESNLKSLHERLRAKRYRHQPIRRVHIPKEQGHKTRPIGISATEDKVVQSALREVLEAVYEQDFLDCSHGFRPRRNAHGAIRALTRAVNCLVLEAKPRGTMVGQMQNPACTFGASHTGDRCLVQGSQAYIRQRAARSAHEANAGAHQLHWSEWKHPEPAPLLAAGSTKLVQVAPPSQPTGTPHLGQIHRPSEGLASAPGPHRRADMDLTHDARIASHISGRAGRWKSPCPDLARARAAQAARATLQPARKRRGLSAAAAA